MTHSHPRAQLNSEAQVSNSQKISDIISIFLNIALLKIGGRADVDFIDIRAVRESSHNVRNGNFHRERRKCPRIRMGGGLKVLGGDPPQSGCRDARRGVSYRVKIPKFRFHFFTGKKK